MDAIIFAFIPGVDEAKQLADNQTTIIWILVCAIAALGALSTYILRHHAEGMKQWRLDRVESSKDRQRYSDKLESLVVSNQGLLERIAVERLETDRMQVEARVRNTEALNLNNEVLTALISKLATGLMTSIPENLEKVKPR